MRDYSILRDPNYYRPTQRVANLSARSRFNGEHVADVLRARRDRENFAHPGGEDTPGPSHPRAGHDAPSLPASSIVERESTHPWRWVGVIAVSCGALFMPLAFQVGVGIGLVLIAVIVLSRVTR